MHGWIKVGDPPRPAPPPPLAPRVVPSAEYPSIRAALTEMEPGTVIEVRPGTYFYSDVTIDVPGVTVRGTGAGPAETVIDGSPGRPTGIAVRADDVRVENLTVRGYNTGILFDGVDGFEVAGVHSLDNRADGILARASRGGVIRNARAAGGGRGIVVQHCDTCDTVIRDSSLSSNGAGIILEDAGSVIIRGSDVRDNGTGIVAMVAEPTGRSGLHIWGNTIVDNTGFASNPFIAVDEWNRLGVGVWMSGVSHSVVERNWIEGHAYAVAITAVGPPSVGHRVTSNTVDATIYGSLAWDGLGADVCFEGNVTIEAGEPSSEPPAIQALYPCSLPHTVGVPFPTVTARLHAP
jgi:hypothetical protein